MYAKFELFQGTDRQYYFRFLSPSGTNLGYSEGYTVKASAEQGIASVKANARDIRNFTLFQGNDGYYYFHLKAQNGEIILRSSLKYTTRDGANSGANEVCQYAPNAYIVDLTQSAARRY